MKQSNVITSKSDGKCNIHYIVHTYDTFQKEPVEETAKYFENVNIFTRTNRLIDAIATLCPKKYIKYSSIKKINLTNIPNNCHVYKTPLNYIPMDFDYIRMGDRHYKSVMKLIKQNNILPPSIIHSHFIWSSGYVGMRLKEHYEVPLIVTGHGYDVYSLPFRSDAWKQRICDVLNAADHIITVSQTNLVCIEKLGVETPVSIIPNGFDEKMFYPRDKNDCRRKLGLPLNKKIILTVGNCVEVKGHRYLIETMKRVYGKRQDVLCVIVGSGNLYLKEVELTKQLGLSDCVKLVGVRPHNEIPIWMNACDLFVLPSLNESFGVVNIEALACGKPIVASNIGGVPSIITSDEYGLLCAPGNVNELTCAIIDALEREWDESKILEYAKTYQLKEVCKNIKSIYDRYAKISWGY